MSSPLGPWWELQRRVQSLAVRAPIMFEKTRNRNTKKNTDSLFKKEEKVTRPRNQIGPVYIVTDIDTSPCARR